MFRELCEDENCQHCSDQNMIFNYFCKNVAPDDVYQILSLIAHDYFLFITSIKQDGIKQGYEEQVSRLMDEISHLLNCIKENKCLQKG